MAILEEAASNHASERCPLVSSEASSNILRVIVPRLAAVVEVNGTAKSYHLFSLKWKLQEMAAKAIEVEAPGNGCKGHRSGSSR